ncbi:MAG: type II secretion system F family protein [Peptococcaceae bacterium]|nr:type II secretion system F family protein [Peptococcaceae bacterium]
MAYVILSLSLMFLILGIRKRKIEGHWATIRERMREIPQEAKEVSDLITAGVVVTSSQKAAVFVVGAALGLAAVYVLTGRYDFALLGLAAGAVAPRAWVKWKLDGQRRLFLSQLESVLNVMSSALIAGANAQQAWEQAALVSPYPARRVLEHVVKLTRSGHSLARALEITGGQVESRDLQVIAAATTLCTQTGGDIASVYNNIAETIRDKQTFKAQAEADLAQGNLTANLLAAIPFAFVALFRYLSPEYMAPLFNTASGLAVFLVGSALVAVGWVVVRNMMQVDY